MQTKPKTNHRSAFSLLELLAVITIIGIISAVVIPRIGYSTRIARKEACHQYRGELNGAIERYFFNEGTFPSLDDIHGPDYLPDGAPKCPVTKTDYALDPDTGRVIGHDH
ncbi:MAG: prepilin-type N-terminal cleavage/methylation domain-containing protein [Pirellulaceae bacterium]|jgi:prepilin-type N-terminal cleavage/methylation domain-containing protein